MRPERAAAVSADNSANDSNGSPNSSIAYLSDVGIFADLRERPGALEALAALMRTESFRRGQSILSEGEAGSELFILVAGEASVFKSTLEGDSYRVAVLQGAQHAVLGEGGLLGSDSRSATIRAESECRCLVLRRQDFERFAGEHPEWGMPVILRIARSVTERLHKLNNDLMLLYHALVAEIRGK